MRGEAGSAGAPRRILVALFVSDAALEGRLAAALADAAGLTLVGGEAAADADVVVSDGSVPIARPTILLADGFAPEPPRDVRAVLPVSADAALLRAAIVAIAAGYALVLDRESFEEETEGSEPANDAGGRSAPAAALSPREREVLNLLAQGASNKVVARRLGISVHTAKYHVASLFAKLGARNRSDAVAIGIREGLVFI
jgi:DNA-binding CsgD family transcriptional regulator